MIRRRRRSPDKTEQMMKIRREVEAMYDNAMQVFTLIGFNVEPQCFKIGSIITIYFKDSLLITYLGNDPKKGGRICTVTGNHCFIKPTKS